MGALEASKMMYDRYLELSGGELPDKFRESDELVHQIVDEFEEEYEDRMLLPIGASRILNLYRRWHDMEEANEGVDFSNKQLYKRFCDMCFRQVEKARLSRMEWRYEALAQYGVSPETITVAFATIPVVEQYHEDVISAYAIPFFGKDAAFVDFITNEDSAYREGTDFHDLVAEEIERDRERRALKAKSKLNSAFK